MSIAEETALKVAEFLLQIKAIKLNPRQPYKWASGWLSPIYCDNRITLSHPKIRTYIRQRFTDQINEDFGNVDAIAGVATAGIPQGVLVAQELGLPFAYVRSEAKGHGMSNLIEGELKQGARIVVVEDLISTGKSSLNAISALREAGYEIIGLISIFNYGFSIATENFKNANCKFVSLSNYDTLIKQALNTGYITESDMDSLNAWKENPENWGKVIENFDESHSL